MPEFQDPKNNPAGSNGQPGEVSFEERMQHWLKAFSDCNESAPLGHGPEIDLYDSDLIVLRWDTRTVVGLAGDPDTGIQEIVNDWLDKHLDREVKSFNLKFEWGHFEGNITQSAPRFIITIHSEKIADGEIYRKGERVFRVHKKKLRSRTR